MNQSKQILTGPDKLIQIVSSEKKVAVEKAAKELGVGPDVVKDWALFLEEEGLITIEYSLSTMFLEERRLSKSEVAQKAKEYVSQKEGFVRDVESSMSSLDDGTERLIKFRKEFEEVKKNLGEELQKVQRDFETLKHYEEVKQNLDAELEKQRGSYTQQLDTAHKQLDAEEHKFSQLVGEVKNAEGSLASEEKKIIDLESQEEAVKKRAEELQARLKAVQDYLDKERASFRYSKEHLNNLQKVAENILRNLEKSKQIYIDPILKAQKQQEQKILKTQEEILSKARTAQKNLETMRSEDPLTKRFERFFLKKKEFEDLLATIDTEKAELRKQYQLLVKKASVFDALSSTVNSKTYMQELESIFKELEKKHDAYRSHIEKTKTALQL